MFADMLDTSALASCLIAGIRRWLKYGYARDIFHDNLNWNIGRNADTPISDEIYLSWKELGFSDQSRFSSALALALIKLGQENPLDVTTTQELISIVRQTNDVRAAGKIAELSRTKAFAGLDEQQRQDFLAIALVALSEMLPVNRECQCADVSSIEDAVLILATGGSSFDKKAAFFSLAALIRIAPKRIHQHLLALRGAIELAENQNLKMPISLLNDIRQSITILDINNLRTHATLASGGTKAWLESWIRILDKSSQSSITRILNKFCSGDICMPTSLQPQIRANTPRGQAARLCSKGCRQSSLRDMGQVQTPVRNTATNAGDMRP